METKEEETLEEYKSNQDLFSFKVPKIEMKEEIADSFEDVEMEQKVEEFHLDIHAIEVN